MVFSLNRGKTLQRNNCERAKLNLSHWCIPWVTNPLVVEGLWALIVVEINLFNVSSKHNYLSSGECRKYTVEACGILADQVINLSNVSSN